MRIVTCIALLLAALMSGCVSTAKLQEAREESPRRVYRQPYEAVFNATLTASKVKKLEVVETDREAGMVVLSHVDPLLYAWSNWGEKVGVFVKPLDGEFTQVEIVSIPRFEFLRYSPNWDKILLDQIDAELRPPLGD
jgi:hypothetical protein